MSLPNEYKYGNYTPKGWILHCAQKAYYTSTDKTCSEGGLEAAIWAAFDAKEQLEAK